MKYTNSVCDGCGLPLRDDDDVVVCPECGTPQHRECYKKENRCVNEHRHSEDFEWKPDTVPADAPSQSNVSSSSEMLPCPSCGHMNPRDAKRCESCSMKLIVFGMNLAEASEQQRPDSDRSSDLPDYEPPYTLGQGDGFDNSEKEALPGPATEQESFPPMSQMPFGQPEQSFPGPDMQGADARRRLIFRFLGANTGKFINAFGKIEARSGITFNWAAFFFGPYWFFYRKLYKPGIVFATLSIVLSVIFTPKLQPFLEAFYTHGYELLNNPELFATVESVYPYILAFNGANLAFSLISALVAYPLYKKYTEQSVDRIMSSPSSQVGLSLLRKLGGTSFLSAGACYLLMDMIMTLVGMIMYG